MPKQINLYFDDNQLLPLLYGEHDVYLVRIEDRLGVSLVARGNVLSITGKPDATDKARMTLDTLWERLKQNLPVDIGSVDAVLCMASDTEGHRERESAMAAINAPELNLRTKRRSISARSPTQASYLQAINNNNMIFCIGPAGTGKTYLAVAQAVSMLVSGQVDKVIISRPAIEAGERLGFLPGDLREKIDPYLRPIYDALYDMLPVETVTKYMAEGNIEVAPLAYMRGRSLSNSFIILDEAQNTTSTQMKMALTRFGENSRMVITGDITQVDLPAGVRSGLREARDILDGVEGISFIHFSDKDVVRHSLVARIINAYGKFESNKAEIRRYESPEKS